MSTTKSLLTEALKDAKSKLEEDQLIEPTQAHEFDPPAGTPLCSPVECHISLRRGAFITLEGIDRAGKSTLAIEVVDALRASGIKVHHMGFPMYDTDIGRMLQKHLSREKILDKHIACMLFAANRWEYSDMMSRLLQNGTSIVCDRYSHTGIAYGVAGDLPFEWCKSLETGLLAPDVVIHVEADPMVTSKREGFGEQLFDNLDFQTRLLQAFNRVIIDDKHGFWIGTRFGTSMLIDCCKDRVLALRCSGRKTPPRF